MGDNQFLSRKVRNIGETDRRNWVLIAAYCIAVLAIAAIAVDWTLSQNFDTAIRIWLVQSPWVTLIHNVGVIELAPPAWHIIAKAVLMVSPFDPVSTLRGFNLALFVVNIPLGYLVGRELVGRDKALIVAAVMPLNPYLFSFVLRTDHYMLYTTLTLLYTATLLRLYTSPSHQRALLYVVATIVYGFTHYYAMAFIGGSVLAVLGIQQFRHTPRTTIQSTLADVRSLSTGIDRNQYFRDRSLLPTATMHAPLAVVYVAWTPMLLVHLTKYDSEPAYTSILKLFSQLGYVVYTVLPTPSTGEFALKFLVLGLFVPVGVYCVLLAARNDRIAIVLGASCIGGAAVLAAGAFYNPRHLLWVSPVAQVLIGCVVAMALTQSRLLLNSTNSSTQRRYLPLTFSMLIVLLAVAPIGSSMVAPRTGHPDVGLDTVTERVNHTSRTSENAVVLTSVPNGEYILRVNGFKNPVFGVPEDALRRRHRARLVRNDYDPATYPQDEARVRRLVANADTVIVFVAHGDIDRNRAPLDTTLNEAGFVRTQRYYSNNNGMIVYERRESPR
jgi:hypothetical protein